MDTLPVTLIVKAPNQQIEDQTIECEPTWTINKLKQHLSEVYPSKPAYHEQKLIYSGQLLSDSLVLKDILRRYEGQETYTVHLVCTSKQSNTSKPTTVNNKPNNTTQANSDNISNNTTNNQLPNINASSINDQRVPNMAWMNMGHDPRASQMDVNQYTMHLAMMQQAYMQYMAQYMQLAANLPQPQNAMPTTTPLPNPQPQQQAPPAAQPPGGAIPAAQLDPENQDRDWLDVFYILSRVMVLFSVVYFYSSPIRFVVVLFLGFALYLYQIGFFRNVNHNNNNIRVAPPINNGGGEQVNNNENLQQEEPAPTRLMVIWTFFATFFASLIPEIPNAI